MDGDTLEDLQECPAPCAYCDQHGCCDDCLDCLSWPRPGEEPPLRPRQIVYGHAEPSLAKETSRRRQQLQITDLIPIAIRRYRRERVLSQRALAAELR